MDFQLKNIQGWKICIGKLNTESLIQSNSFSFTTISILKSPIKLFILWRFNVAEIGAMSRDIPHEAKVLVKRMRSDPNVIIQRHWKLITILIGPNDFCSDFCYLANPEKSADNHRRELIETLRILRDNLPRTIVQIVTPPSKSNKHDLE